MKTSKNNLERARELLNELHDLENALYVTSYRSDVSIKFSADIKSSFPNKTVEIPCPTAELRGIIVKSINKRISEIKDELEKL